MNGDFVDQSRAQRAKTNKEQQQNRELWSSWYTINALYTFEIYLSIVTVTECVKECKKYTQPRYMQ